MRDLLEQLLILLLFRLKINLGCNPALGISAQYLSGKLVDLMVIPIVLKLLLVLFQIFFTESDRALGHKSKIVPCPSKLDETSPKWDHAFL